MFENSSIAITGASGGIGRAIAEMFIAGGAKVTISDRQRPDKTAQEIGATAFKCDVTREDDVIKYIQESEALNGPIDIFVANAGIGFMDGAHAANSDNQSWELSWQVNVMGAVYAARQLLPEMQKRGNGRFVITASAAGLLNQIGGAAYSTTKHAAVGFAEALAISHWDEGIKTHCICPQYVRTNLIKDFPMAEKSPDGVLEPKDVAIALKNAISQDQFMVLTHPNVKTYFQHKAHDYQAYITNMNKLKSKFNS